MKERYLIRYDKAGKVIGTERVPEEETITRTLPVHIEIVKQQVQYENAAKVPQKEPKPQKESRGYTLAAQMVTIGIRDRVAIAQAITEMYERETERSAKKIAYDVASVLSSLEKSGLIR
jgi:hypothetical protein